MDSPQRWWYRSGAGTAAASVVLLLTGDVFRPALRAPLAAAAASHVPAMAAVRSRVELRVLIEAPLYRKKLDGDPATCGTQCQALQQLLSDTARVLFAARYGFVDWGRSAGGAATLDTVTVRLLQRDADARLVKMQISMGSRAAAFGSAPEEVDFETKTNASLRPLVDWNTARLRTVWADSLSRRLDAFSERILSNVVGRLPLGGDVVLDGARPSADVRVLADSLRAADSPAPKFVVRLAMPSPTPSGDVVTDTGEMVLEGCRRTGRGFYACEMGVFSWRDRTGSDTLFRQKARNARVSTASVHLRAYSPLPRAVGAGGIVTPPRDNP